MNPAASTLRRWRENPVAFAVEVCKFEPDAWQREFLSHFPSQDAGKLRMSLQACTGPGKTAVEAIAGLNFISCYGGAHDHPRGMFTSISGDNLSSNLWPALSEWQNRSEWLKREFKWTATRFSSVRFPETWFIEARTWSKKANAEEQGRTLSGLHAPFILVILDESGDIPVPVLKSGEQIFSSQYRWAKLVQAGNPTSQTGALYHAAVTARPMWHVIRITGDPEDPQRSPRINIENARKQIKLYGRDDPWVKATILGEFPPASINALMGGEEVLAAMEREVLLRDYEWAQKRLGVDVSRFGDDPTVYCPRQGLKVFPFVSQRHQRDSPVSVNIANRIMLAKQRWGTEMVLLDATGGWAAGARDILDAAGETPISIQYHAPAPEPRFKNMRAFMWWTGVERIRAGMSLPNDPELPAEISNTTYTYVNGQILLEPKDRVKEKIGRSPNKADALFQTFAIPDMPAGEMAKIRSIPGYAGKPLQSSCDFDPFRDEALRG